MVIIKLRKTLKMQGGLNLNFLHPSYRANFIQLLNAFKKNFFFISWVLNIPDFNSTGFVENKREILCEPGH